jgi:hypothetical protein
MKKGSLLFFLLVVWAIAPVSAQIILGRPIKPVNFDSPIDIFDNQVRLEGLYATDFQKSSEKAWVVINDRHNNPTYHLPNGKKLKSLQFKSVYYVTEEHGEWIHIAKGRANGLELTDAENMGWVEKGKILLWTNSLIHDRTGIEEKIFLVHKLDDVEKVVKNDENFFLGIYDAPDAESSAEHLAPYKIYFIFKKENGRYLVDTQSNANTYNASKVILGWVNAASCVDWNTRLCLEPNFEYAAFKERKENPQFRMIAFKDRGSAKLQAQSGIVAEKSIFFDLDPCFKSAQTAIANPLRYPGSVMRFPLLSRIESSHDYFRTGIVGNFQLNISHNQLTVGPVDDGLADDTAHNKKLDNFDIVFVCEHNSYDPRKDEVLKSMVRIVDALVAVPNVRIGTVLYGEPISKESGTKWCVVKELVPAAQVHGVIAFLKNYSGPVTNNSNCTAMYYGLDRALKETGLSPDHTNILFVIGQNADIMADPPQNIKKALPSPASESIVEALSAVGAHVFALQTYRNETRCGIYFARQTRHLILNNALAQYYSDTARLRVSGREIMQLEAPTMPDTDIGTNLELSRSAIPGALLQPIANEALSAEQISRFLIDCVQESYRSVRSKGPFAPREGIAAGSFGPIAQDFIQEMLQKSNTTVQEIVQVGKFRHELFAEVFIPRQIKGAHYPTCSFVAFMTSQDMANHILHLERLINRLDESDNTAKRQQLFEALREWANVPDLTKEEIGKLSLNQLMSQFQGVKGEGLFLVDPDQNILLGNITNPAAFTDEAFDNFILRIIEKTEHLKKVYRQGKQSDFAFSTGDEVYFWVPVQELF